MPRHSYAYTPGHRSLWSLDPGLQLSRGFAALHERTIYSIDAAYFV